MDTRIVGVDCATDPAKTGLAFGYFKGGRVNAERAFVCAKHEEPAALILDWLAGSEGRALLAIDAPLGWPAAMGGALARHAAGAGIAVEPNLLFRRETDRFIQRTIGKTPLDVGADRIARTAHAALALLAKLRIRIDLDIPLAWSPDFTQSVAAIEVYPSATLKVRGIRSAGYKKPGDRIERDGVIEALATLMGLPKDVSAMSERADALDAAVCLLAAGDFLEGSAVPPVFQELAVKEGWIWVRSTENQDGSRANQQ